MTALPPGLMTELASVDVTVSDVPLVGDGDEVVLATCSRDEAAVPTPRDRITLFRRPLEARARDRPDLRQLTLEVLVQQLAELRGFDDDRLHDLGWS